MKKILFALLIILFIGFAQVTLEEAQDIIRPYVYQGEQIDINPQRMTFAGAASYWVMEAVSLGQVQIMFPVDTESGIIDRDESIKEVLKTHYLANFFDTDTSISDYLDSQLTYAQQKKDFYANAYSQFEFYEAQFDENVELTELSPLKSALSIGESKADSIRSQVSSTKQAISSIQSPSDISTAQSSLTTFFTKQEELLDSAEDIKGKANELLIELAGNDYLKENRTDILQALQGVISSNYLAESVTVKVDSLAQNRDTVNAFFADLDAKTNEYYTKLNNRVEQSAEEIERREILEQIGNYSSQYDVIVSDGLSLSSDYRTSSGFDTKLEDLYALLNESYAFCSGTSIIDCRNAKDNYDNFETSLASLRSIIDSYSPTECVSGQTRSCTTSDGGSGTQTCENNTWGSCVAEGGGLNWSLIIFLLLIIAVLVIYKFRDKLFKGGEKIEKKADYLSIYKR